MLQSKQTKSWIAVLGGTAAAGLLLRLILPESEAVVVIAFVASVGVSGGLGYWGAGMLWWLTHDRWSDAWETDD